MPRVFYKPWHGSCGGPKAARKSPLARLLLSLHVDLHMDIHVDCKPLGLKNLRVFSTFPFFHVDIYPLPHPSIQFPISPFISVYSISLIYFFFL